MTQRMLVLPQDKGKRSTGSKKAHLPPGMERNARHMYAHLPQDGREKAEAKDASSPKIWKGEESWPQQCFISYV